MLTAQKKQKKVVTTVRIDPTIKVWAQSYAQAHGTDFSTLINMQLFQMRKIESLRELPYMSDERYSYYRDISHALENEEKGVEDFSSLSALRDSYNLA